jgi:hypothetical protein
MKKPPNTNQIEEVLKKAKEEIESLLKYKSLEQYRHRQAIAQTTGVKGNGQNNTYSKSAAATGIIKPYEIGKTKTNKSIMSHPDHPAHNGFNAEEHKDAYFAHAKMAESFKDIHPSQYHPDVLNHYNDSAAHHWNEHISMKDAAAAKPQYNTPKNTISSLMRKNDDKDDDEDNNEINLVHYSRKKGLKTIDPKYQGTGSAGEETKRGRPEVVRANYYREGTRTEPNVVGFAESKYHISVDPKKLYDLGKDKDGIIENARKEWDSKRERVGSFSDFMLGKVREAGHEGYHNSDHSSLSNAVALFHPQEPLSEHEIDHDTDRSIASVGGKDFHIKGQFGLMTPDNPKQPHGLTHEDFQKDIEAMGLTHTPVAGHYGEPENSYLIHDASPEQMKTLGKKYNQECIVHSDGKLNNKMIFTHGPNEGKMAEGSGAINWNKKPHTNYTVHEDRPFSLKVNTNNLKPYEEQ